MDRARRRSLVATIVLTGSFVLSSPAEAQRSGFIMGFGMGAGVVSSSWTVAEHGISDRVSKAGVAMGFHIGGVVGNSLELYLMLHAVFGAPKAQEAHPSVLADADYALTRLLGIGFTYPLNTSFSVKGAVGIADESIYGPTLNVWDGVGLLAGGRYRLGDVWGLDLDVMHGRWNSGGVPSEEGAMWGVGLTLNILRN